jgi:hypothetical protein
MHDVDEEQKAASNHIARSRVLWMLVDFARELPEEDRETFVNRIFGISYADKMEQELADLNLVKYPQP